MNLDNFSFIYLVLLVTFHQKPTAPPKPKPAPSQKPVAPTFRQVTRPAEPAKPTNSTAKPDSFALSLLASGAESHKRVAMLESTLDWRYLSKANLSFRPTSALGQKALEATLRSAQATLTLTKDGQARLGVTTPGKDPLPRATTIADTKTLFAVRYDTDGKPTSATERALAPSNPTLVQTGARQVLAALPPPVAALLLGHDPLEDAGSEGRLLSVELAGNVTVLREVGLS
ncbi:hypothetical protein [Armatimonas sp.]|uniref:hypothetical protein n=1 Tax=Armatimonas sp. TaxID=1872638 RepID=UPI003752E614